jgi:NADH-quinone oxidoreductase subunit C
MMENFGSIALRRLLLDMPDVVEETHAHLGDATAVIDPDQLLLVLRFLREEPDLEFEMLMDVTCVDYLGRAPRFEMVYHLFSVAKRHRLRIKARVPEAPAEIDSAVEIYPSANWMEREVWDLYGVRFRNHPDLRRLMLYEEFEGHPLRKDYAKKRRQPLVGPRN